MDDAELIAQAEMSPCVGVCKLDDTTGWCYGCGRTQDEIDDWQQYDEPKKELLEAALPDRVRELLERRRAERGTKRGGRRARAR